MRRPCVCLSVACTWTCRSPKKSKKEATQPIGSTAESRCTAEMRWWYRFFGFFSSAKLDQSIIKARFFQLRRWFPYPWVLRNFLETSLCPKKNVALYLNQPKLFYLFRQARSDHLVLFYFIWSKYKQWNIHSRSRVILGQKIDLQEFVSSMSIQQLTDLSSEEWLK